MLKYSIVASEKGYTVRITGDEPEKLINVLAAIEEIEYEEDDELQTTEIKKMIFGGNTFSKN
jgi:hypothetical protein